MLMQVVPVSHVRISTFTYWAGLAKIKMGYCPSCSDVFPPSPDCAICHGSPHYGPNSTPARQHIWRVKWVRAYWSGRSKHRRV